MLKHKAKIYTAVTVIIVAVILVFVGLANLPKPSIQQNPEEDIVIEDVTIIRHPLNGQAWTDSYREFFAIGVMLDNAYNINEQPGLERADIVYEALVEGPITRLLAIFDSNQCLDKIGPVRSARPYFLDWVEEYNGVYMHVGGSPQALNSIDDYDFVNIDQIGAGEIYFWRDNDMSMPANVFTSNTNWLRVGEIKEVPILDRDQFVAWNFVEEDASDDIKNVSLDFSSNSFQVDWKYNTLKEQYQRWQGDVKHSYATGEQIIASNVVVLVADDWLIDAERRNINTADGGLAFVFNKYGHQDGVWLVENGRTLFFDKDGNALKLNPGQTWIEVINTEERLDIIE
jgi:hypothetical protein